MLKKIIYGLLGLSVLVLILGAIYLIPPHQQIRRFESAIPSFEQIEETLNTVSGPVDISYITTASQKNGSKTMGHVGIVLRWADGRTFLIDAGMDRATAAAFGKPIESFLGADPTITFGPIEEQMSAKVSQISGVAFTHLHSDHTAGISAICRASSTPTNVFQTSDQTENHNALTEAGQQLINESGCSTSLLNNQMIKPVPDFDGLVAIAAGGHTPGSTIYVAKLKNKIWVFAGDITNDMESLIDNKGKGFIYSYLVVPENTARLAELRLWLAEIDKQPLASVLVAHDLDAMRSSELFAWAAVAMN
ncbi:MAG: glyoxylase-like metal-dependent hydrolase (beta-lactamase superfamily II) [Oceanicoccus sp.]|jgi:glyoxylase-like metal-dependent hydrolase (beta-lactamase superfamily II)